MVMTRRASLPADPAPAARLEIRDLRLLTAVAAEGSLTGAGRRLNVTQPALSRHLATLESRVGAPLFHRTGARMVPAAAGELLLRHAHEVLDRLAVAEADLAALRETVPQVVRVGTECYTGFHWLPAVSRRFSARRPGVEVEIAFEASRRPLELLKDGRIDVAILTEHRTVPDVAVFRLFNDELVAVVPPGHAWTDRAFVEPEAFEDVRLLLLAPPEESTVISKFLEPAGVEPKQIADVQLVGALAALVEAEFGVGVLPAWTIGPEVRSGRLVAVRLGRKGLQRTWAAAVAKSRARERWVRDFVSALATEAAAAGRGSAAA
jgi:LysR family transcriptional regulator, regulator for metE and metH